MDKDKYLYKQGAMWIIASITEEENRDFGWKKVTVFWSGIGPRPLWADDGRIFLMDRKEKTNA